MVGADTQEVDTDEVNRQEMVMQGAGRQEMVMQEVDTDEVNRQEMVMQGAGRQEMVMQEVDKQGAHSLYQLQLEGRQPLLQGWGRCPCR